MKTNKWIILLMMGATLSVTPSLAQRPGGGSRSASSAPRGGGSRSYSAPSRSYSAPTSRPSTSRSYSTAEPGRSHGTPSTRTASSSVRSHSTPAVQSPAVHAQTPDVHSTVPTVRSMPSDRQHATVAAPVSSVRPGAPVRFGSAKGHPASGVRPGFARPDRPRGPLPPSHRPLRPAPFFYHPVHHYYVHMRPLYWDPFLPAVVYWPGMWSFCVGYWAGSGCTNEVVVREYVSNTHHVDMISYAISGDLMYALVRDGGDTYLRVFDKADNLLAQHPVHRKYSTLTVDPENGGCWIMKKRDKDPMLFLYVDGELLIYEADS
ncbi:MAG: hypothetical protein AUK63_1566 [bacterium P3]|nr:MAG: hypothetical protein AUK63_1566 [bacterium P3]KWW41038.1 MAG: hypothetical protein F083_1205 [bacterium F083]